jgi:hypothetical protein
MPDQDVEMDSATETNTTDEDEPVAEQAARHPSAVRDRDFVSDDDENGEVMELIDDPSSDEEDDEQQSKIHYYKEGYGPNYLAKRAYRATRKLKLETVLPPFAVNMCIELAKQNKARRPAPEAQRARARGPTRPTPEAATHL